MKLLNKSSILQKIIIALLIVILFNFMMAPRVYAGGWDVVGTLAKELIQLILFLIDALNGLANNLMLGVNVGDIMLSQNDPNLTNPDSWLYVSDEELNNTDNAIEKFTAEQIDTDVFKVGKNHYEIPNMLYSPENIFSNNIAALDINFLKENTFESVITGDDKAEKKAESLAGKLSTTIASWYISFRNIAVVGLLSVLIYIGIRILISSTAVDKAKYKENLKDWLVALCLVFFIHFIMSGILMITDKVNELFASSIENGIIVKVGDDTPFRTNLMGLIRFRAQSREVDEVAGYAIMYIAIFIYTGIFTFMYFKRFLYMAFFTMIAPLVALTYPIDKAGDGKAQAFNIWFKEYLMNVIIQPVHLIIYTVFVSSALDLAASNVIYALVAIGFLIPAEKFIKSMFGLDKAQSSSPLGSFAGGALAMQGLNKLASLGKGGKKSGGGSSDGSSSDDKGDSSIFMPTGNAGKLTTFPEGSSGNSNDDEDEDSGTIPDTSAADRASEMEREALEEQLADGQITPNELTPEQRRMLGYPEPDTSAVDRASEMEREALEEQLAEGLIDESDLTDDQRALLGMPNPSEENQEGNEEDDDDRDNENDNNNNNEPVRMKSKVGAVRGLAGRAGRRMWNNRRKIITGAARVAGATIGTVGGAMIGTAAGITTGDPSKVFGYAAAGTIAGKTIGAKAGNLVNGAESLKDKTVKAAGTVRDKYEEERFGLEAAANRKAERENKKAEKVFYNDSKEQKRYKDMAADIGYKGDYKDLMKSAVDYKKAGVQDDMIKNAIKLEAKDAKANGYKIGEGNHEKYVDVAAFANKNGFNKSNIEDEKKRKAFEDVLESKVGKEKGYEVGKTLAALYDREDLYKSKSNLRPNQRDTSQSSNTSRRTITVNNMPTVDGALGDNPNGGSPRGGNATGSNRVRRNINPTGNNPSGNNPTGGNRT